MIIKMPDLKWEDLTEGALRKIADVKRQKNGRGHRKENNYSKGVGLQRGFMTKGVLNASQRSSSVGVGR